LATLAVSARSIISACMGAVSPDRLSANASSFAQACVGEAQPVAGANPEAPRERRRPMESAKDAKGSYGGAGAARHRTSPLVLE
jgi:hypothetical protein